MKIYKIEDVAEMFGCSVETIRRWIRQGQFPHGKKMPNGQIWTEEALDRFMSIGQATEKEMKVIASIRTN